MEEDETVVVLRRGDASVTISIVSWEAWRVVYIYWDPNIPMHVNTYQRERHFLVSGCTNELLHM